MKFMGGEKVFCDECGKRAKAWYKFDVLTNKLLCEACNDLREKKEEDKAKQDEMQHYLGEQNKV